jgi:hypothetical protein
MTPGYMVCDCRRVLRTTRCDLHHRLAIGILVIVCPVTLVWRFADRVDVRFGANLDILTPLPSCGSEVERTEM